MPVINRIAAFGEDMTAWRRHLHANPELGFDYYLDMLAGFGTFNVRKRKTRVARNPRTGDPVDVPSRSVPVFKPSKHLRGRVAKLDEVSG